jgi:hypothetical protein
MGQPPPLIGELFVFILSFNGLLLVKKKQFFVLFLIVFQTMPGKPQPPSLGNVSWKISSPQEISPVENSLSQKYPSLKFFVYFPITNTICKEWTNCITYSSPRGYGGHTITRGIVIGSFNYAEQNSYKFF